jgi:hypothetical protein
MLQLIDPPSIYTPEIDARTRRKLAEYRRLGGSPEDVQSFELLAESYQLLETIDDYVAASAGSVVLDISSMPKRFFFPIVRKLLGSKTIRDFAVTYTHGERHFLGSLAEDPEPAAHLPLFAPSYPEKDPQLLAIGLGLQPLGLPEILEDSSAVPNVQLFFPFPAAPENVRRIWEFVRIVADRLPAGVMQREPVFVAPHDCAFAFEQLLQATENGRLRTILAPFGPKPISLAMCLYACAADAPAYYTQPRIYNPQYSTGVRIERGEPATYVYFVRLSGNDYFTIPKTPRSHRGD